jgi:hypothetical protein
MGTLIPEMIDPQCPDHRPIPSAAGVVAKHAVGTAFALTIGLSPLCPVHRHLNAHDVHREYQAVDLRLDDVVGVSSSGDKTAALTGVAARGSLGFVTPSTSIG